MKSSKVLYKIAYFLIVILVAVFTVGYAFAWFFDRKDDAEFSITGKSAGAYFESGNGSEETPFIISNPTHMHNLAVLQNSGKLNNQKYYFQIKKTVKNDEIDMTGRYIPPIGNDEYPFIGDFDGNGKTLKNLQVTTNKSDLAQEYPNHAKEEYEFSQAVGLFGMTGSTSDIHNVILENPTVDVASSGTKYSTSARAYAGLAVGYVAGKASSIGVRAVNDGSALDVQKAGYSTFNSILGMLGDGVTSSVTGGGHGQGGSGAAFGANFDMSSVLGRLYKIYEGKYGVEYKKGNTNEPLADSSPQLPKIDTANSDPVPAEGAKIAFTVNEDKSTYVGPDAEEEISDQNVGYFLGNQNKFDTKNFSYKNKLTEPVNDNGWNDWRATVSGISGTNVPAWLYTYDDKVANRTGNGCYSSETFRPLTDAEFDELPDGIKNIVGEVGTQQTFTTMRISQDGVGSGNWGNTSKQQWSYHGRISWMGKTYGDGFNSADGYAVDENGNYYLGDYGKKLAFNEYTGGIALPNNAIWFKPNQVGKFRFVMYSQSDGDGFILNKITRTNASIEEPFKVDPDEHGNDVVYEEIMKLNLPSAVLFYFDYNVDEEEYSAGNVEFMLQMHSSHGAHFVYLDIGASAEEDVSTVDREKAVSAIDFIYDGVEIKQGDPAGDAADAQIKVGDFIVKPSGTTEELYNASKTSVYFENLKAVLNIVFIRLNGDPESKHSGKTICLEKSNPVPDTNSEVKATNTTYVCPTIGSGSGGGGTVVDPDPGPETPTVSEVTVTPATANVEAGKTTSLTASVTMSDGSSYDGNIVWASSDEDIATVENGVVTAKSAGSVTITATAGGISASATITVEAATVPVSGVTLDKTEVSLSTVGATQKLNATVNPTNATDKTVTWTSSNTELVTVDNSGKIEVVKLPATDTVVTITATAGGISATCTVTVTAAQVDPPLPGATDKITLSNYSNVSGSAFKIVSDSGYFNIDAIQNYTYNANHGTFGESLVAGGNNRGLTVIANNNETLDYSRIKITLRVALANTSSFNGTTVDITYPTDGGASLTCTGGTLSADGKQITTEGSGTSTICTIEITLEKGKSISIGTGRFALLGASSEVIS